MKILIDVTPAAMAFALTVISRCCTLTLANPPSLPVPNVMTYPLISYHTQRRRRRHLLNLQDHEEDNLQQQQQQQQLRTKTTTTSDASRHRASRRRSEAQQVGALYQGIGTHYVDIWCGTPPQRQTVIVDTGSGVTAFPCSECQGCGVPDYHIDTLFQESESSTYRLNSCTDGCKTSRSGCNGDKCTVSVSYMEGSRWDAVEAVDTCYIGGFHEMATEDNGSKEDLDPGHVSAFDLVFGCQSIVTRLFVTQLADGIMGMNTKGESFWYQMFQAGKMGTAKQFSLCFSRSPTAERKGTEAGAVTLGGTDKRFHQTPMVYSSGSNEGRDSLFSVRLRKMYLRHGTAGESVVSSLANPNENIQVLDLSEDTLNAGGIIVDSGTTDTLWNYGIAKVFNDVFKEMSGGREHSDHDISLTHDELMALPTILFQLVSSEEVNVGMDLFTTPGLVGSLDPTNPYDVLLAFPPSHYMAYDTETGMYSSSFFMSEGSGSVFGASLMMGHDILFDSDNHRIGWAESDCDYTRQVTENGFEFPITGSLQSPSSTTETVIPPPPPDGIPEEDTTSIPVESSPMGNATETPTTSPVVVSSSVTLEPQTTEAPTTSPVVVSSVTLEPQTTEAPTTSPVVVEPQTTEAPTTSPVVVSSVTLEPQTTEAPTTSPVVVSSITLEHQKTNPLMSLSLDWFEECIHTECKNRLQVFLVFFGLLSMYLSCHLCCCLYRCCCHGRKKDEYSDIELKPLRGDRMGTDYHDEYSNDDDDDDDDNDDDDDSDEEKREFDGDFA